MTETKKTISGLVSGFFDDLNEILEAQAEELKAKAKASQPAGPSIRTKTDSNGRKWLDAGDLLSYVDNPRSNQATLKRTLNKVLGR